MEEPSNGVVSDDVSVADINDESDSQYAEDSLEQFREEWQRELQQNAFLAPVTRSAEDISSLSNDESKIEEQAQILFFKGIQAEQDGALYEAIGFYKKAIQLVPDIERRIDFRLTRIPRERQESESSVDSGTLEEIDEDLLCHFKRMRMTDDNRLICQPVYRQRATHISALPIELVIYIFKWVVSNQLDMRSLEVLSQVCRGFFVCARDEELWKLACHKVWGSNSSYKKYGSWRTMFVKKAHLLYHGCYISKASYVRQGEKSLDNFYREWHLVEYYRYVRFFPNGIILMMTSAEDPPSVLSKLKYQSSKFQGVLKGYYCLSGKKVSAKLKRVKNTDTTSGYYKFRRRQRGNQNEPEQSFHVVFDIKSAGKKSNSQLIWSHYSIKTLYRNTGEESESDFDLNNKSYPPLFFSRVKSYTSNSEIPLQ